MRIAFLERQPNSPKETGSLPSTSNLSSINHLAATERQRYLEKLFYYGAPDDMVGRKAITNLMESLIIEPIDNCIQPQLKTSNSSSKKTKNLPSIIDWQNNLAPSLSFIDFQKIVNQTKQQYPDTDETLLYRQYIIKILDQYAHIIPLSTEPDLNPDQLEQATQYAVAPPINQPNLLDDLTVQSDSQLTTNLNPSTTPDQYNDEQQTRYENIKTHVSKVYTMTRQMRLYGIDKTINYYRQLKAIDVAETPKELDIIQNYLSQYPEIAQHINKPISELSTQPFNDEIVSNLMHRYVAKRQIIEQQAQNNTEHFKDAKPEMLTNALDQQFKAACQYFNSLIPTDQTGLLDQLPYLIQASAIKLRRILPVENAEVLAKLWWQLRLGGARAEDVYSHLKTELPEFVQQHRLERYTRHLADNYLGSEAAGFEMQKTINIPENITSNQMLFQVIKDLIRHHIPKDQQQIRFTLLDGENQIRKIVIPYKPQYSDQDIKQIITNNLSQPWKPITLDDTKRAELSYLGYNAKKRSSNSDYRQIYYGFGQDQANHQDYSGDYLIQINTQYNNTRDPRSLFAVNSHKVAVQLRFIDEQQTQVTARYNHQHFDGNPAQIHTKVLLSGLSNLNPNVVTPGLISTKRQYQLDVRATLQNPDFSSSSLPLTEARYDHIENDLETYKEKKDFGDGAVLTPVDIRGLVIALANQIDHYQQLVGGDKGETRYLRNPNYDNIQPVVVALSQFNQKNLQSWIKNYRQSVQRAKHGIGDVALMSAITGTREAPLCWAGSALNPTLIRMLRNAQGMISPLSIGEDISFTTAISDAYRPEDIDLNHPIASLGVIGLALDKQTKQARYTTRLLPAQAQTHFRQAILDLVSPSLTTNDQHIVLSEFTKIIKAWNKLVSGDGPNKSLSLNDYQHIRDSVLANLKDQEYLTSSEHIKDGSSLQRYLNNVLQQAAQDIFNPDKIAEAKKQLQTLIN